MSSIWKRPGDAAYSPLAEFMAWAVGVGILLLTAVLVWGGTIWLWGALA